MLIKIIIKTIIIFFAINVFNYSQKIWDFPPDAITYLAVKNDTSLTYLEEIVQNDSLKNDIIYFEAAHLLAYYEPNIYKEIILNKLKHFTNLNDPYFSWSRYFRYQLIRGYLGETGAIGALDSVVQISSDLSLQLNAISWLVEVGEMNYFVTVKDALFNKGRDVGSIIAQYGKDSRFTTEASSILSHIVSDSTDFLKISSAARNLAEFDKPLAIETLQNRFFQETGDIRLDLFYDLGVFDPDGQPERSMFAIPLEKDDFNRGSYFPVSAQFVEQGISSRRYLSPFWIKFIQDWDQLETEKMIKSSIKRYIEEFQPALFDSSISLMRQFDSIIEIIDTTGKYSWLGDLTFSNELKNILTTAKTNLQNGDSLACRVQVKEFQDLVDNVYKDSLNTDPRFVTIEGWKFLYWNAQYILDRLPEPQTNPNLLVNLKNSLGVQIPASNVMYYESAASGWKDAVNNGDGTFTVITTKPAVSIRMFYEYANQTVHNVPAQNNTYTFTTVNAAVELKNSSGNLIDQGTVQYYAGAWRNFGTTTNGVANKELLPINYSFRMTYEYVPNDKQQDINTNSTVTFTTVLCTLKVTNSNDQPLAGASTKYYSLAWRDIGLTNAEGMITKELLPKSLNFRASYRNATKDKQQDTGVNNLVEIQLNTQ